MSCLHFSSQLFSSFLFSSLLFVSLLFSSLLFISRLLVGNTRYEESSLGFSSDLFYLFLYLSLPSISLLICSFQPSSILSISLRFSSRLISSDSSILFLFVAFPRAHQACSGDARDGFPKQTNNESTLTVQDELDKTLADAFVIGSAEVIPDLAVQPHTLQQEFALINVNIPNVIVEQVGKSRSLKEWEGLVTVAPTGTLIDQRKQNEFGEGVNFPHQARSEQLVGRGRAVGT